MKCPLCKNSDNVIQFEKSVYVEGEDHQYYASGLYGCKHCNILFTNATKVGAKITPDKQTDTVNKAQQFFGNLSNQCNKILSNIK